MKRLLPLLALVSLITFPWPYTVLLTLAGTFFMPYLPALIGISTDVLYAVPHAVVPLWSLVGIMATVVALFVRSRLKTGSIGG